MKIKSVRLWWFKRFSDLHITGIPETARLVVLVGPNGTGKTSLLEAFNFWISPAKGGVPFQKDYHWKAGASGVTDSWDQLHGKINIEFYSGSLILQR